MQRSSDRIRALNIFLLRLVDQLVWLNPADTDETVSLDVLALDVLSSGLLAKRLLNTLNSGKSLVSRSFAYIKRGGADTRVLGTNTSRETVDHSLVWISRIHLRPCSRGFKNGWEGQLELSFEHRLGHRGYY